MDRKRKSMGKKLKSFCCVMLALVLLIAIVPCQTANAATPKLNKKKISIYVGNTYKLKLWNASNVKWSSKNVNVATVNSKGVVTGKKPGSTTILAQYKNKTYQATVVVKNVKLNKKSITLSRGSGYPLKVLKTKGKVKWSSSKPTIVKVNKNGYISGKKPGRAVITAKIQSSSFKCTVRVVDRLSGSDFNYTEPEDGYTNYIDLVLATGKTWYIWFDRANDSWSKENRKVDIGDTYSDVIKAFGYTEEYPVSTYDKYREHFSAASYPRTYVEYKYRERQAYYCKKFYFDRNGNLVLIIWHTEY